MTRANRLRRSLVFLGVGLAWAPGCANFEEPTRIIDLRTLAIQATQPEIHVDPNMLDARFLTTLTALVVDPAGGGRPVSYQVVACPREIDAVTAATGRQGVICKPFDPLSTEMDRSVAVTPPDAAPTTTPVLGLVHEFVIRDFDVPRELLERAFALDPFAAVGFQMPIVFQFTISAGDETEIAIKRVIFSLPPADHPEQTPNANPVITVVNSYADRDADGALTNPVPLDADPLQPLDVPLGGSLWIKPEGATAEPYYTLALTKESPPQLVTELVERETLRFTFLTTAGSFAPGTTSSERLPVFNATEPIHIESKYRAPTVLPATGSRNVMFWIMVRDERGGVSWTMRTLRLVDPAP